MFSEEDFKKLNSVPLTDVMRAWGHHPVTSTAVEAMYLCPWHDDHDASLRIDNVVREGCTDLGFACFGRDATKGFGAVALAAKLMDVSYNGELRGENFNRVARELCDRCEVKLEGTAKTEEAQRSFTGDPIREPQPEELYDITEWTEDHLRALGFEVKERNGLYRCSIDPAFFRGRGEVLTLQEWGERLENAFSCYPVSKFVLPDVTPEHGGRCSVHLVARSGYPIFAFVYGWGLKKYEPRNTGKNKWAWWTREKNESLAAKVYGDAEVIHSLEEENHTVAIDDKQHPWIVTGRDENGKPVAGLFKRLVLCSGPRDAMHIYAHTDAHVVWLNSETAGINDGVVSDWLKALLVRLSTLCVELFVCYDIDATGMTAGGALTLANMNVRLARLPRELLSIKVRNGKVCKDVVDYVQHFGEVQKRFSPHLRQSNVATALMRMLNDALPVKFWNEHYTTKKDAQLEKTENVRYVLNVAPLKQFVELVGIHCHEDARGNRVFYKLYHDNTYEYLEQTRTASTLESTIRCEMEAWLTTQSDNLDLRFRDNLVNVIFTGKGLDARVLNTMTPTPLNEHSYGKDFDYFFFSNAAVRVTADDIVKVPYISMPYVTNRACIMPGEFSVVPQAWRVTLNPDFESERQRHERLAAQCTTVEMRAAENLRWTRWAELWKYKLVMDKPLGEMPMHFRFLYNMGRCFWEKESLGDALTETERQIQDMYFIGRCHALGYALTRYRSRSRQQIVHLTEMDVDDERKASGRNGKTAIIDAIGVMRPGDANVTGQTLNKSTMTLAVMLGNVRPGVHCPVCIDELPDGFDFRELYNAPTELTCKTLYQQPVTIRGDEVPKIVIASNKSFDLSSGSTKGRIYPVKNSNYYHAATDDGRLTDFSPGDEFFEQYGVREMARNLPPKLLNELMNLLCACAQLFLQYPDDTIVPPTENRSMRRELYAISKDAPLVDWLMQYFELTDENPHFGQPIPPQEMAISLLDFESEAVNTEAVERAKKRIAKNLKPMLRRMGVVMDPEAVLDCASYRRHGGRYARAWLTQLDANGVPVEVQEKNAFRRMVNTGVRVPRILAQHIFVHYFYINAPGKIPSKSYDAEHIGDPDYVQPAAERDPETAKEGGGP